MCPLCRLALALLLAAPPSELHPSLEEKKKIHTHACVNTYTHTLHTHEGLWMFAGVTCVHAFLSLSRLLSLSRALSLSLSRALSLCSSLSRPPSLTHTQKTSQDGFFSFFLFFWDTVELSEGASESMSLLRHFFLDSAAGGFEFL